MLERAYLAWDGVRVTPERQRARAASRACPISGYDDLDSKGAGRRLAALSQVELAAVEVYERSLMGRPEVLDKLRYMRCSEPLP